jgi:cytosolic 5'-nucleotidase 3
MENIILNNKAQKIIDKIISEWVEKLHILADFDKTLTKAYPNGKDRWALISVLYNDGYLSEEYQKTAQWYYKHYHAIEIDETISLEQRKNAMLEWWTKHKIILIKEWISKQHIYDAMKSENLELRDGSKDFFESLYKRNVPIVILSAGWLWTLSIEKYLENNGCMYDNINLIGNDFVWDENGVAIDFKKPIIHSMNKDETVLKDFPIFDKIKDRKNIILLWDSPSDVDMAKWFEYDNLLKIWFFNKTPPTIEQSGDEQQKVREKNIEKFKSVYDVLILNDGDLSFVNEILRKI